LWRDLHALQILFSHMNSPVYFALVYFYGCVTGTSDKHLLDFPQVSVLACLASIDNPGLFEDVNLPPNFTVVPLFALEPYSLGFFLQAF
jgi:hypothetical protein